MTASYFDPIQEQSILLVVNTGKKANGAKKDYRGGVENCEWLTFAIRNIDNFTSIHVKAAFIYISISF